MMRLTVHPSHLTHKQVATSFAVIFAAIIVVEVGVARHFWSHGDGASALAIALGWTKDFLRKLTESVLAILRI